MFGIYDTGASVISISAEDQGGFGGLFSSSPVPILQPGGAGAQGIGGDLTGDVSKPGTILADGLHAFVIDFYDILNWSIDTSHATSVPSIQTFVGTASGSASLPSITGTPIHSTGLVSKVDRQDYKIDFGDGWSSASRICTLWPLKPPTPSCPAHLLRPRPCGSHCNCSARAITPIPAFRLPQGLIPFKTAWNCNKGQIS